MRKLLRMAVLAVALGTFAIASMGCYGKYALTQKIHSWNGTIGNKLARSAVHLLFVVVPVYAVCALADFLVINNIEFLTGNNVVAAAPSDQRVVKADGGELHVLRGGQLYVVKADGDAGFTLRVGGETVGRGGLRSDGGMIFHHKASGRTHVFSADQVAQLRAQEAPSKQQQAARAAQPLL